MKNFLPIINSASGFTLTTKNWEDVGIESISCNFLQLLFKPGLTYFKNNPDIKDFFDWHKTLLLDISDLHLSNPEAYVLKSPFDGSKLNISKDELIQLFLSVNIDGLIISFADKDLPQFKPIADKIFFKDQFLISDKPLQDARNGLFYLKDVINLLNPEFTQDFSVIDDNCTCPVCSQNLTKAYLQHIFKKVPLLSQRYLAEHNLWQVKNNFASFIL